MSVGFNATTRKRNARGIAKPVFALFVIATAWFTLLPRISQAQCPTCRLGPFEGRAQLANDNEESQSIVKRLPPVPQAFSAWWSRGVHEQMGGTSQPMPVTLESLIVGALQHSSQLRVFKDQPLIRRTAITEAEAEFDWRAFLDTRWNDISEPVGNTLTVGGGRTRFNDHDWDYSMGLRRRNQLGGQIEVSQDFGFQNTNSIFFVPQNQGTARLKLSYTQPLLHGAGRVYNTSLIVLAELDTQIAQQEFSRQLQNQLLEIARSYWALYLERGNLLQKRRLYEQARKIYDELKGREKLDAPLNQIARARAAVTARRSDLLRSEAGIRNAAARIRALVNDPMLSNTENAELIPQDMPTREFIPVSMRESLTTALQHRPEVGQALKNIKAASIRMNMSKKDLLPVLDLVFEGYASGLKGNSSVGRAFTSQFDEGAPSYAIGLQFEVPLQNRAALARLERRQLELRQMTNQLDTTAENLMLEVEVSVREVSTSYREVQARFQSMRAAAAEVDYLDARWKQLAGDDRTGALYLEDLLAAQERLTEAEFGFLDSQVTYNVALINLKRATGVLLQHEQISIGEARDCLPELILDKASTNFDLPPEHPATDNAPMPPGPQEFSPEARHAPAGRLR